VKFSTYAWLLVALAAVAASLSAQLPLFDGIGPYWPD
jgi:hypothetical protein